MSVAHLTSLQQVRLMHSNAYWKSNTQPQAQQICSAPQSSGREPLLSPVPVDRICLRPVAALVNLFVVKLLVEQSYLLDESVAFVEEARNIIIRVVIDKKLLVPELSFVKTGDDRAGVQYVRYTVPLQRLQVPSSTDWPYTPADTVSRSDINVLGTTRC